MLHAAAVRARTNKTIILDRITRRVSDLARLNPLTELPVERGPSLSVEVNSSDDGDDEDDETLEASP